MRLLVTGGSGLLGSKIAVISLLKGYETYSGYNEHLTNKGQPVKLNVCDLSNITAVFDRTKPDAVIHAAALSDVDKCEREKTLAWKVNVEGTKNIAEASKSHASFLVYISTDYVFSGEKGMYKETDETNPINYYGLTKLEGENIVKRIDGEWCIARPSVIYGATPAAGKVNFALWVLNKLQEGEPIKIINDQWVSPTLNTNLAQMILEIVERRLTGTYHLAGATPLNRHEFATLLAEAFQLDKGLISPSKSDEMKWLATRPQNTSLNVEKATETLKNKPLKIEDALKKLKEENKVTIKYE